MTDRVDSRYMWAYVNNYFNDIQWEDVNKLDTLLEELHSYNDLKIPEFESIVPESFPTSSSSRRELEIERDDILCSLIEECLESSEEIKARNCSSKKNFVNKSIDSLLEDRSEVLKELLHDSLVYLQRLRVWAVNKLRMQNVTSSSNGLFETQKILSSISEKLLERRSLCSFEQKSAMDTMAVSSDCIYCSMSSPQSESTLGDKRKLSSSSQWNSVECGDSTSYFIPSAYKNPMLSQPPYSAKRKIDSPTRPMKRCKRFLLTPSIEHVSLSTQRYYQCGNEVQIISVKPVCCMHKLCSGDEVFLIVNNEKIKYIVGDVLKDGNQLLRFIQLKKWSEDGVLRVIDNNVEACRWISGDAINLTIN